MKTLYEFTIAAVRKFSRRYSYTEGTTLPRLFKYNDFVERVDNISVRSHHLKNSYADVRLSRSWGKYIQFLKNEHIDKLQIYEVCKVDNMLKLQGFDELSMFLCMLKYVFRKFQIRSRILCGFMAKNAWKNLEDLNFEVFKRSKEQRMVKNIFSNSWRS